MKRLIAALCLAAGLAVGGNAQAAGAQVHLDKWPEERGRQLSSLQNGARIFANYCLGCHSANQMRWNRLSGIGLDERQIREFLIFGDQKVGEPMSTAMRPADAKQWFGKAPPDLSVITRARTSFDYKGTDYLYSLMRGYYRDAGSPTGWNNVVFPSIGMPHILWQRQGAREATIERLHHEAGGRAMVREVSVYDASGQVTVSRGEVTGPAEEGVTFSFKPADAAAARQYDSDVADLVAFLNFMTDPSAAIRVRIGVWVLLFLALFTVIAWWLNREFWKDVK